MERRSLGAYQLKRLLGRGGMGEVHLALDPRLSREVALKVLFPDLARELQFRERFLSEARAISALNHPNITTIHEVGEADGVHYIAFEHVEGETLDALLARDGAFSLERFFDTALPLSSALAYAHGRGVVHRDLKTSNVIVSSLGIPKILDFGLAKRVPQFVDSEGHTLARLTQAGMIVGTISSMAPEQALGEVVDRRSDVFSFGALLYEMLTARPPFTGTTPAQVLDRLLHHEPAPMIDVPDEIAGIVQKALRKSPEDRFQSMDEMEAELRATDGRRGSAVPAPRVTRSSPASRRRGSLWIAGAAALGLAIAGALFVGERDPRVTDPVAVMYFENVSDAEDTHHTARMLSELLTSQLSSSSSSSSGGLRVLSRHRLQDVARSLGRVDGGIDASSATDVAEAAGVRTMVVGQVVEAGDRLMATADLVDIDTGRSLSAERTLFSSSENVFDLAASLGEQLRADLAAVAGIQTASLEPRERGPTVSVDAYRHYVQGEVYINESDLESAVEELSESVRVDPDFSLAHHRLSMAARWLSDAPLAHQAARRAAALIDRAPAHLRDMIRANALYQDGAFSQAIPLLDDVLARDPGQKEALYVLSQIYVHSLRDGDIDRGIETMNRLLALDPSFHQVYDRLALSHAFRGDFETARRLLADWEGKHPDKVHGLRSVLATFEGQPEEALGFAQAFSWIEGPFFQAAAAMMASRWDVAGRLVEQDTDEWRSDHLRSWALRNRGVYYAYTGRFDEAVAVLRQAGMAGGLRTHEGADGGVPASALEGLAELLYLGGEPGAARTESERALSVQPESWRGLYFAGRLAAFEEDTETARRHLTVLEALPAVGTSRAARIYLRALEAEIALEEEEAERAVDIFEGVVEEPMMLDWASSCSSAGALLRDGLVRAYLATGEKRKAMRALEALIESGAERIDHPVIYVQSLYQLGVLEIEGGSVERGRALLRKVLDHWGDADWELPLVADARERLGS